MVRNSIIIRGTLALLSGYGLAAAWQVALARWLPLDRIDATITATMLAFAIYTGAAIWAFAAPTLRQAAAGLLTAGAFALVMGVLGR